MSNYRTAIDRILRRAMRGNLDNILSLVEPNAAARFVDLGCADGSWSLECAARIGTNQVFGVEIVEDWIREANGKGVQVRASDLNERIPFDDGFFDCVHSNQVIEHLVDTDRYLAEHNRVLKMGGYLVLSTENAASWHNIGALLMGWQMFSLTNISDISGIGNPFALWRGRKDARKSMQHMRIFAYRGLREYIEYFGFKVESVMGSGYYPLPWWVGRLDPRHSHYLAIKARKVSALSS